MGQYWGHLNAHRKEVVLHVVKTYAHEENDWRDNVEDYAKGSIVKGLQQAKAGNVIAKEDVMKKYKKWLSK